MAAGRRWIQNRPMDELTDGPTIGPRGRFSDPQRRLLLLAAALIAAFYVAFALAGVYPLRASVAGLGTPVLFAMAAWRLGGPGR